MHGEEIRAELTARYHAGEYQSALDLFDSLRGSDLAQLSAESIQTLAQCYARLGDLHSACGKFIDAAVGHIASRSPNASICLTNASLMLDKERCDAAAEWLGLFALRIPALCDAQLALLRSLVARYQRPTGPVGRLGTNKRSQLLWAALAAGGRFPSTRSSAYATLLSLASANKSSLAGVVSECELLDATTATAKSAAGTDEAGRGVSIIVCSHRDDRFAAFEMECRRAFAQGSYEIIRISNAQSMCDGYNRGRAQARNDLLIFCHDDIEFLGVNVGDAVRRALADADVVMSVGASACDGPAWWAAPTDTYQGWTAFSTQPGSYGIAITGVPNPREQLVSGDGFLIACRKAVVDVIGWDEASLTGFHLYDMDFVGRAAQQYRVAALRDVMIHHKSGGAYDEAWWRSAERFVARHGGQMRTVPTDNLWICGDSYSRTEAERIARNLSAGMPVDWLGALTARSSDIQHDALREFPSIHKLAGMLSANA